MNIIKKILSDNHTYFGVILSIPILLVGITAVFLSNKDYLKSENKIISTKEKYELKDVFSIVNSESDTYFASKKGIYKFNKINDDYKLITESYDIEPKDIIKIDETIFIAAKKGLYKLYNDKLSLIEETELKNFSILDNNVYLAFGKNKILRSNNNGKTWTTDIYYSKMAYSIPDLVELKIGKEDKKQLNKIMKSIHTGKFLGKYEWLWGTILGFACVILPLSGIYIWIKNLINKNKIADLT